MFFDTVSEKKVINFNEWVLYYWLNFDLWIWKFIKTEVLYQDSVSFILSQWLYQKTWWLISRDSAVYGASNRK